MIPDVIDEAYVKMNARREELFYAFFVFGNKFAVGITLGLSTGIYKYVFPIGWALQRIRLVMLAYPVITLPCVYVSACVRT